MNGITRTIRRFAVLLAVVAGAAGVPAQGHGGGNGGGPGGGNGGGGGPSGTIYYVGPWEGVTTGGTAIMTAMDADGSNVTRLGYQFGPPSTALHAGHRWFVMTKPIPDSYYPDASQRMEVFALRDDHDGTNSLVTRVQITDDGTLQPELETADWLHGDQMVSFKGRRWSSTDPNATVTEGGLYVVPLAFAPDGNITGGAAAPTSPILPFPIGTDGHAQFAGRDYGWHPDNIHVVYSSIDTSTPELWIADVTTGIRSQVYGGYARHPRCSPDGTMIAFTSSGQCISTIRLNGSRLKRIISSTPERDFYGPFWSPDGSSIVCTGQSRQSASIWGNRDVFRASASGGSLTNLTNTLDPLAESPWGWR